MDFAPPRARNRRQSGPIPVSFNFDDHELGVVAELLQRRYGRPTAFECAEAEIELDPAAAVTRTCPALYWEARGAQFVVCKAGEARYRGQFFEGAVAASDIGQREYADVGDCVTSLLRLQSDREREHAGVAGTPGA